MAKEMGSKQTKTNTEEVSMKIDESQSSKLSTNSAENSSAQWLQSKKCNSYVNWLLETRASEAHKLLVKNSTGTDLEDDYRKAEFQESNSTEVDEQYETYSLLDYPDSNQITYYKQEELGNPRILLTPTENMKRYYLYEELNDYLQEKCGPAIKETTMEADEEDSLHVQYECSSRHLPQNLPSVFSNCSILSNMSDEYGDTTDSLNNEEYIDMEELGLGFLKDGNWIPTDVIAKTIWKKLETSMPAGSVQAKWNRSSKTFPEIEQVEIEDR